jgi:hypothetical protein
MKLIVVKYFRKDNKDIKKKLMDWLLLDIIIMKLIYDSHIGLIFRHLIDFVVCILKDFIKVLNRTSKFSRINTFVYFSGLINIFIYNSE